MAEKEHKVKREIRLEERKWFAAFIVVVAVMSIVGSAVAFGAYSSGQVNNGALRSESTDNIANAISQAWGWNGTAYLSGTLTLSATTQTVTIAFPADQKITSVVIFTDNSSMDVQAFLGDNAANQPSFFQTATITLTNANLHAAYAYIGIAQNSSNTNSLADKSIIRPTINQTLYGGSTNNLGQAISYPMAYLVSSPFSDKPLYMFQLTPHVNATLGVSVALKLFWSYPFVGNLVTLIGVISTATFLFAIVAIVFAYPRHRED